MTTINSIEPAPISREMDSARIDPRGALLEAVFELLDREGVAYCVPHGYQDYPAGVKSDVDLILSREMLPRRLASLLHANEARLGARVVQWFEDRARFIVLASAGPSPLAAPVLLQLHVSADYELCDRVLFRGEEILQSRQTPVPPTKGFWVPPAWIEFGAVLGNRVVKKDLDEARAARLAALWTIDPIKCSEQAARLLGGGGTEMVCAAAGRDAWAAVRKHLPALRRRMLLRLTLRRPVSYLSRLMGRQFRRMGRWLGPHAGLHVVFLGPDGVGKSTVIDAVRDRVGDAFLRRGYQTFARGLLPMRPKDSPHALPPRSLPASAIKAAWWALCYTVGYYVSIYPTLARGGLMINHRYLLDALVDPKRYRYSGPSRWIQGIWRIAPKPDLIVILDAPAEVIHQRKQEVALEEARRQCEAYRALASSEPHSVLVDASQSAERTIARVTEIILSHMAARVARQARER